MPRRKQVRFFAGVAGAFCLSILPCASRAQVSSPVVTLNNKLFHYNYSIRNTSANDLFDVDIHVLSGAGVVSNIVMPTGFTSLYDYGLGLVSFTEDTGAFTAVPLSGFGFDSAFGPHSSTFDSNYADLTSGNIITTSGSTLAAVPEPGSIALIGSFSVAAACALRRARRKRNA